MTSENKDIWKELRKPFPKEAVGLLPKPYKKDSPKGKCNECGGYHGLPAVHLDYVGHAAVTDRLLNVDPAWTWEPVAVDPQGAPALDKDGNLWIRLTIGGVTRLGVGDGYNMKERIGDAIRNAAMRFGVALDLWTKDELESHLDAPELKNAKPTANQTTSAAKTPQTAPQAPTAAVDRTTGEITGERATDNQIALIKRLLAEKGVTKGDDIKALMHMNLGRAAAYEQLTKTEGSQLIDYLTNTPKADVQDAVMAAQPSFDAAEAAADVVEGK